MRKIESQLTAAIARGDDFRSGNTTYNRAEGRVALHGHTIAQRMPDGSWRFNLQGWNTATTRSRLNAMAYVCRHPGVWVKAGQAYTGSRSAPRPVDSKEWF